jgi:hypothetical protein
MVSLSHLLAFRADFHGDFAADFVETMHELDGGGMLYRHPEKQG